MFNKKKKNNKGFTLVELLVVIAIIGILAVVAVPSLMKNIDKSKTADLLAEYNAVRTACLTKYTDAGSIEEVDSIDDLDLDNIDSNKYTISVSDKTVTLTTVNGNYGADVATELNDELGTTANATHDGDSDIKIEFTLK